jgi:hypothetical protein
MAYRLRPRLSACVIAEQAIFLDTERDRYFSLGGAAAHAIVALQASEAPPPEGIAQLKRAGLLEETDAASSAASTAIRPAAPLHSLVEEAAPPWRLAGALAVTLSLARATRALKHRPLQEILDRLSARRAALASTKDHPTQDRGDLVRAFLAARRLAPIAPRCLPDSLALLDQLARRGLGADLVFGVKLNPFSAHCWLQADDIVLNDAVDHVTLHTPILVV